MSDSLQISKNPEIKISIRAKASGEGYTAVIEEPNLPVRFGDVSVIGEGANSFLTIRSTLRQTDAEGNFITAPRQKDGKFLDARGKEVDDESKASRVYVPQRMKNDDTKLVWATIANLNVQNTKSDGTPTKSTFISGKFFSDVEARDIEAINYKISNLLSETDEAKKAANVEKIDSLRETLKEKRKSTGTYINLFLDDDGAFLTKLGHEVRKEVKPARAPRRSGKGNDSDPAP
ncbi:hypothetical protein ACYPKM_02650 [Pseudomonas aeruginosa]